MKKIYLFIIMILIGFMLTSCGEKTYESLYDDYQSYVDEQTQNYQSYIDFVNQLSNTAVKSVVSIEASFLTYGIQNLGSGAVIDEDDQFYYVLTNSHVVMYNDTVANQYVVRNYLNESVNATYMFSDENYDLALLKIAKTIEVTCFEIDTSTIMINDSLIVIGYPNGQNHAITMGYFIEENRVVVDDQTSLVNRVTFNVIVSSVPVKSGSSGSAILNEDLKLVGLIFAGRFQTTTSISTHSYAIPAQKILEFLLSEGYGGLSS